MLRLLNTNNKRFTTEFFIQFICGLAIILGFVHVFLSLVNQSMTHDEYNHYSYSRVLLDTKIPPERTGGHISTTPVIILNVLAGDYLKDSYIVVHISHYFKVSSEWWPKRTPGLFWFGFLVLGSFLLGRLLFGSNLAYLIVVCVSLSPSLIAHSSVVTVDVPYASSVVFLTYSLCLFYRSVTLFRVLLSGFFLGTSLVIKFTGVLLVPIFVFFILFSVLKSTKIKNLLIRFLLSLLALSVTVFTCCLTIISSYLFVGIKYWTNDFVLSSGLLRSIVKAVPNLYLPLPQSFVSGIDACFQEERREAWNVILWDQFLAHGSPWYFPANYIYKTPSSILLLTFVGLLCSIYKGTIFRLPVVLAQFLIGFYYFCFIFQTQVGFRYILFLVPLFYVLTFSGFRLFNAKLILYSSLIILLEAIITFAPFSGYLLAYYNSAIVSTNKPYMYVTDSNFDWGQTGELFWNKERSSEMINTGHIDPEILQPGRNTYSANRLVGVFWDFPKRAWVRRNLIPIKTLAHTFFVFDVHKEQFASYLEQERTFYEEDVAKNHCKNSNIQTFNIQKELGNDSYKHFAEKSGQYCIYSSDTQVISIIAKDLNGNNKNTSTIGIMQRSGECKYDEIHLEQSAWFRLLPGQHVICIKNSENTEEISSYQVKKY